MKKSLVLLIAVVGIYIIVGAADAGQAKNIRKNRNNSQPDAGNWYVHPGGNDSNPCDSPTAPCATIHAAIGKAVDGDTIYVATGIYTSGTGQEVVLIDMGLTLLGGWNDTFTLQNGISTIDGQNQRVCINIHSSIHVLISMFDLKQGSGSTGGGIINSGTLLIQDSIIHDNAPSGIFNQGDMTIIGCTVYNNGMANYGGGINNEGQLTLIRSSIHNNAAYQSGGGIMSSGSRTFIINSTISKNHSNYSAGGIQISDDTSVKILNTTITENVSTNGTGGLQTNNENIPLQNSIIAGNKQEFNQGKFPDCFGTIISEGYNLIGNTTGCFFYPSTGDILDVSPLLIPVETYYGLLPASPAIDSGNPTGCLDEQGNPLLVDQRGYPRPLDGNNDGTAECDMGAYELDPDHPFHINFLPIAKKPCPRLYFDDFSNPSSGWPVVDTGNILLEYKNDEYRILLRPAQWYAAARPGFKATNYEVSVYVRNINGTMGSYGIAFGITQNWSGLFTLELYPDGWFGLYRYDQNGGALLAEAFSPAIRQGTGTNQINIRRNGPYIQAYANGVLLADVWDAYFSDLNYLGLINFSNNELNIDVRFDNFIVDPVDCGGVQSQEAASSGLQEPWSENPLNIFENELEWDKHLP